MNCCTYQGADYDTDCQLLMANLKEENKKLSYRPGTVQCVVSVEVLPIAMQQCRNYLYDKSWTNGSYEVRGLRWTDV